MELKRALITGITGQDGSYLSELLLSKNYEVHGMVRRSSLINTSRIDHLYNAKEYEGRFFLHHGDMGDSGSLGRLISTIKPHEIYNLAAQSHVRVSFEQAEYTVNVTGLGAIRLFEAVRDWHPEARVYQASSSEMFGASPPPQSETTPFKPRSPYAYAKVMAHNAAINHREAYGQFIACGILFNHESPRRGETFVTRKITKAVARIRSGKQKDLVLGNLTAKRDWGFAGDYVRAMWLMLQQPKADDYVIATGRQHTVMEFAERAFAQAGLRWSDHVKTDPRYLRPTEVDSLCGNPDKAMTELGWKPEYDFDHLVLIMVREDVEAEYARG